MSAPSTILRAALALTCIYLLLTHTPATHPVETFVRHIQDLREHNRVNLEDAVGRTVCAFTVEKDIDEMRVPQLVKHVRCVPPANLDTCVQLHDTIFVEYVQEDGSWKEGWMEVDVGCVCTRGHHVSVDGVCTPN